MDVELFTSAPESREALNSATVLLLEHEMQRGMSLNRTVTAHLLLTAIHTGRVLGIHHLFSLLKRNLQIKERWHLSDLPHGHHKRQALTCSLLSRPKMGSSTVRTHWDCSACKEEAAADATTSYCSYSWLLTWESVSIVKSIHLP